MENPSLFTVLQPRNSQLVPEFTANGYRPKSTIQTRKRKQLDTSDDRLIQRPPSQQSSKSSKRIVYVARNGKKIEPLEVETSLAVPRYEDPTIPNKQKSQTGQQVTETDSCLSDVDPFILDTISLNDPIWTQILPDYLIDQVDIAKLVEENPEYFHHHLGLCACYRCRCGRCRCDVGNQFKLRVNGSLLTVYGKDFIPKNATDFNKISQLNQLTYQTRYLDQETIDQQSTKQSDFQYKKPFKFDVASVPQQTPIGAISNLTSYRQTFGNWGVQDYGLIKRVPHVSTSGEIPFVGKTIYQETFCSNERPKAETPQYRSSNLSPLPTGPFFGTTTSQKAFAPFKIMQQRSPTRIEQATQSHFHNCDRDLHTHQFTMVSSKLQPSVTSAAIMKLNVLHQCTRRCGNRS